jgi:hypothetical protein
MANPIKETPVLYGEDARRFAKRIAHVKKEPMEKRERIISFYQHIVPMGRKSMSCRDKMLVENSYRT